MAESIVTVVERHIGSMINNKANRLSHVQTMVDGLRSEMIHINNLLLKAEVDGLAYDEQIRGLGAELRRIAYEIEDLIDTIASNSNHFLISSFIRVGELSATRQQLRELKLRTEDVKKKLLGCVSKSSNSPKAPRGLRWKTFEYQNSVVAIDDDVEKLVKELVAGSDKSSNVLAIVGMGGSGKTTMAGRLYSHRLVKRHFDCQAWVTLTQKWDTSDVLLDILTQAAGNRERCKRIASSAEKVGHRFDLLESHLEYVLIGKRCLIVLDDVWHSDSLGKILYMLTQPSEVSGYGNKIIITSRNRILNQDSRLKWSYHDTECLSEFQSWELFEKVVSKHGKKGLDKEFKVLGMEMLTKCKGLPLAIVSLATLLKTKRTIEEWENVFSQIKGAKGISLYRPVNDILALSFEELPDYLKPCFLYLGIFPQGARISTGMLIRMWIAEGFVLTEDNEPTLEEAARRCLKGLIDHSMVQVEKINYAGKVTSIVLHDMMRDLCLFKAREHDFLSIFPYDYEIDTTTTRRAAIDLSLPFTNFPVQNSQLRSLVLFEEPIQNSIVDDYVINRTISQATLKVIDICQKFKLLRVLNISRIKTHDGTLPKQIGGLIHLRYLRMRSTNIQELPKSIGKLQNLLTLDYWGVYTDNKVNIPEVLSKLQSLRHLYLPTEMSGDFRLHTLKDLQTLWGVKGGNWIINEMEDWNFCLQKLFIQGITSSEQILAVQSFISRQDNLYALALDWSSTALPNLDAFFLSCKLLKLRLMGNAPESLGCIKLPDNLQKLELYYTKLENHETLEAIGGLRSLRFLRLSKDSYVGSKWICSKKAFPKLEVLKVSNLKLEDWKIEEGSMPSLKKLSIVSCRKLSEIPQGIQFINSLRKLKIERMPHGFCSKLQQVEELETVGEDFYIIQHIREVKIRGIIYHDSEHYQQGTLRSKT